MNDPVLIIDNGGCTCKVGWAGTEAPAGIIPNCAARGKGEKHAYIADTLLAAHDVLQLNLRRPIDRGCVVNWGLQKEVWNRLLRHVVHANPLDTHLLLTEPLLNLPNVQDTMHQVIFEEYGFRSAYCCPPSVLSCWQACHGGLDAMQGGGGKPGVDCPPTSLAAMHAGAAVIVDAGFSSTTIAPFFDGRLLESSVRRINLGGKLLTNYFKELVSYRSINVMDEPYLVERIKERVCFVSQDLQADLTLASKGRRSPLRREYVLPDGLNSTWGMLREPGEVVVAAGGDGNTGPPNREQILVINNERFLVPELLFNPSDLGLQQAGLAEAIAASIASVPVQIQGLLWSNIVLTGGSVQFPGLLSRLERELRPLAPCEYTVRVTLPEDPVSYAWRGGSSFAAHRSRFASVAITKYQYEEQGLHYGM